MPRLNLLARPQPFLGILLVSGGWALSHQLGSNAVFDGCGSRGGGFVILVSLLGLAIVVLGGIYSLRAWRRGRNEGGRGVLGLVGALLALIAGLAIALQVAAGAILPACFG